MCSHVQAEEDHHHAAYGADSGSDAGGRLLGDLGYEFRPGSYFYAPQDQAAVITGDDTLGPSVLAQTRIGISKQA